MTDVVVSCKCGTLKGVLHDCSTKTGSHVLCYCKDCQAGARFLDATHILDEFGGTDIFQTVPSHVEITQGQENLACFRLSPKGLMRWYATCCNTPMFNTLGSPKLSFVGLATAVIEGDEYKSLIGPVIAVNSAENAQGASGDLKSFGFKSAGFHILKRHIGAKLRRNRSNPFFDGAGNPVVIPRILTLEERKAATPD